jgi:hypothetical protein
MAVGLAHPALMGSAWRAQLADDPTASSSKENVRLLTTEQPSFANLALDVWL